MHVSEAALIGGFAADDPSFDAVGSLSRARSDTHQPLELICTGTLIGPNAVLTAKHCAREMSEGQSYVFSIGPDALAPRRSVPIASVEQAPGDAGGWNQIGPDVAVLRLAEPIADPQPIRIDALPVREIGAIFLGVGFGVRNAELDRGLRRAGPLHLRATSGFTYGALLGGFEAYYLWYTGKPLPPACGELEADGGVPELPAECPAQQMVIEHYRRTRLEEAGEMVLGATADDAQPCHGDSGGPLLRRDSHNELRIYAVASGGIGSRSQRCDFGAVYAGFTQPIQAFIHRAAGQDACR